MHKFGRDYYGDNEGKFQEILESEEFSLLHINQITHDVFRESESIKSEFTYIMSGFGKDHIIINGANYMENDICKLIRPSLSGEYLDKNIWKIFSNEFDIGLRKYHDAVIVVPGLKNIEKAINLVNNGEKDISIYSLRSNKFYKIDPKKFIPKNLGDLRFGKKQSA